MSSEPSAPAQPGVRAALERRVAKGELVSEADQIAFAEALDRVLDDLRAQRPASKGSSLGWLFGRSKPEPVRGLYVHGPVGRGKSMLMDMFFDLAPHRRKRRVHFHAFMADVHDRIHAHRQSKGEGADDPIPPVAEHWANEARLLCFDEFAVTDVADAMILSRLFTALFERGVTVVATSNVAPRDLYRHGLNREAFLKFVDLLERRVDVLALDGGTDWRRKKLAGRPVWFVDDAKGFEEHWRDATGGREPEPATVARKGRDIRLERTVGRFVRASFADLCERPLGSADYLALVQRFDTFYVEAIPMLGASDRNAVKRFIALIDALYEARAKVVALAEAEPEALYPVEHGTEAFEFRRTVSRLVEMRGEDWPPTQSD